VEQSRNATAVAEHRARELRPRTSGWRPFVLMAGISVVVVAVWQFAPSRETAHPQRAAPTLKMETRLHSLDAAAAAAAKKQ
jgi:hypothetical protein